MQTACHSRARDDRGAVTAVVTVHVRGLGQRRWTMTRTTEGRRRRDCRRRPKQAALCLCSNVPHMIAAGFVVDRARAANSPIATRASTPARPRWSEHADHCGIRLMPAPRAWRFRRIQGTFALAGYVNDPQTAPSLRNLPSAERDSASPIHLHDRQRTNARRAGRGELTHRAWRSA